MAATDERARHELYLAFENLIGAEKADTLMATLLTSDRTELVTKSDLIATKSDLRAEIQTLRAEMHDQFRQRFRSFVTTIVVMNSALVPAVAAISG